MSSESGSDIYSLWVKHQRRTWHVTSDTHNCSSTSRNRSKSCDKMPGTSYTGVVMKLHTHVVQPLAASGEKSSANCLQRSTSFERDRVYRVP